MHGAADTAGPDAAKSRVYWDSVEPTIDGMLGGFSRVSAGDIVESRRFLSQFFRPLMPATATSNKKTSASASANAENEDRERPTAALALDCGAGIGRISKLLLLSFAEEVHLLEQSQQFLDKSLEYVGQENRKRIQCICASLQSFEPEAGALYDIIWLQWVTGYLTDQELVSFLIKIQSCLNPKGGCIFVKDNTTSGSEPDNDMNDSSVTRPKHALLQLFSEAQLSVTQQARQRRLPRGLYPVFMFALRPIRPPATSEDGAGPQSSGHS